MHLNPESTASNDLLDPQADDSKPEPASYSTSHLAPRSLAHSSAGLQSLQRESGRTLRSHTACKSQAPAAGAIGADQGTVCTMQAQVYVQKVKEQFSHDPGVYRQFLDTLQAFMHEQFDTQGLIERVSTLFVAHPQLIQEFNSFLSMPDTIPTPQPAAAAVASVPPVAIQNPTGTIPHDPYTIGVPPPASVTTDVLPSPAPTCTSSEYSDALDYLDAVKAQLIDDPGVYDQLLETLRAFKHEQLDTPGVIQRVSTLFSKHPTLIEGFRAFHPPGY